MPSLFNFFHTIFTNKKISFATLTLLWVFAFITWLPFLDLQSIFISTNLNNLNIIQWISANETSIFSVYIMYLCLETCLLALTFLCDKFNTYPSESQHLYNISSLVGVYLLLLFQISNNLGITSYGIVELSLYILNFSNIFILFLAFISHSLNAMLLSNIILGYFYNP